MSLNLSLLIQNPRSVTRHGSFMLSRARPALCFRPFSTTPFLKDESPRRQNPLIGVNPAEKTTYSKRKPYVATPPPPPSMETPPPPPPPETATTLPPKSVKTQPFIDLASVIGKSFDDYTKSLPLHYDPVSQPTVHTRPVTGRTIFCEGHGKGAAHAYSTQHAFQMLDRLVKDQKLKTLFYQQRFYERKGMERKRLRMQRWRVRFKKGFKAAAGRVLELKKQGW